MLKKSIEYLFVFAICAAGALLNFDLIAQSKQFVCTPCGGSCDSKTYTEPGSCPTCRMDLIEKKFTDFENLSFEEICSRVAANPSLVLLDVRSANEFKGTARNSYGILKNAINIDVRELPDRLNELDKYKDAEVIVYCSHSMRSPRATTLLIQNGFTNVSNMMGGVSTLSVEKAPCATTLFIPFN